MVLKLGVTSDEVKKLKVFLNKSVDAKLDPNNPFFGSNTKTAVKKFQKLVGISQDGVVGPITSEKISSFYATKPTDPVVVPPPSGKIPAPIEWEFQFIGKSENDKEFSDYISQYWGIVGLPQYHSLAGNSRAWCGFIKALALYKCGLSFPDDAAAAASWSDPKCGIRCGYISGAYLPLRHAIGGRHITQFLYWVDEAKKLAACFGGNQDNHDQISVYNLSGNASGHDEVVGGPWWHKDIPQTGWVYKPGDEKVAIGGSTR